MKQRVSRRNRRTAPTQARPVRNLTILAISLTVFLGGAAGIAWAVHAQAQDDEAPPATSRQSATQSSPPTGTIVTESDEGAYSVNLTGEEDDPSGTPTVPDEAAGPPTTSEVQASEGPEAPASGQAGTPGASSGGEPQPGYVVHHTAYREQVVYRTVHHQASTPREVTVGGRTHIEWTSCPVCGQRHANAYNERVVDHVNPVPCTVCGGRHDADYDETVYG